MQHRVRPAFLGRVVGRRSSGCPILASHPLLAKGASEPRPFEALPGPSEWPVVGSFADYVRHDGISRPWVLFNHYYQEHGPIVKQNLFGDKEVVVYHPAEYLKVFQNEGSYPKGIVSDMWPYSKYLRMRFGDPPGLTSNGETWLLARRKLQKHMFAPKVAATYAPYLALASRRCSEYLGTLEGGLLKESGDFMEKSVFELFTAFAFGEPTRVLTPDALPVDLQFVKDSQEALSLGVQLCYNPLAERFPNRTWHTFVASYDRAYARCKDYVLDYVKARAAGQRTYPSGEGPYLERCLEAGELSQQELEVDMANVLMAAVDTTVHVLKWLFFHLAQNPDVQEKLAEEFRRVLGGRDYDRDDRSNLPYLNATIREAHRLTPASWQLTSRRLDNEIVLADYRIPAGTKITFNVMSVQQDPAVVGSDVKEFKPERFLADAVESRKGNPLASILDHRLLSTPFSFGARMCMGARVAEMEVASHIARVVQDWRFVMDPPEQPWEMRFGTMLKAEPFPAMRFTRR